MFCITGGGGPEHTLWNGFQTSSLLSNSAYDSRALLDSLCRGFSHSGGRCVCVGPSARAHTLTGQPRGPESKHVETHTTRARRPAIATPPPNRGSTPPSRPGARRQGPGLIGTTCSDCLVCAHRTHCEDVQRYVQRTPSSCRTQVRVYNATCRTQ